MTHFLCQNLNLNLKKFVMSKGRGWECFLFILYMNVFYEIHRIKFRKKLQYDPNTLKYIEINIVMHLQELIDLSRVQSFLNLLTKIVSK